MAVGYYRYKDNTFSLGLNEVYFRKGGIQIGPMQVYISPKCDEDKILKYLDRNGQYRFHSFNRFWQLNHDPSNIGSINKSITSLITDRTDRNNIGYRDDRTLRLVDENVTAEELEILSDIFISPRVFLYIGQNNSDLATDYIEVTVRGDNIIRNRKNKFTRVDLEVKLPQTYTITML